MAQIVLAKLKTPADMLGTSVDSKWCYINSTLHALQGDYDISPHRCAFYVYSTS